jgi:hypothetical protein
MEAIGNGSVPIMGRVLREPDNGYGLFDEAEVAVFEADIVLLQCNLRRIARELESLQELFSFFRAVFTGQTCSGETWRRSPL